MGGDTFQRRKIPDPCVLEHGTGLHIPLLKAPGRRTGCQADFGLSERGADPAVPEYGFEAER
jgi:hypothetical protein